MSSTSGRSMNYLSPPPSKATGSLRSYDSNSSLSSTHGEVHINSAYDYADSGCGSVSSGHYYEDLQSVRTVAKTISGPKKKTNDLYEPASPIHCRVRHITECSDDSTASSVSTEVIPVKRDTCLSKLILFLILAVSVAALVLVILIIFGKIGPKCSCSQGNEITSGNEPLPVPPSASKSESVQSLVDRIQYLERSMTLMKAKTEARERAVNVFVTKYERQVEHLQTRLSSQEKIINKTANKVAVVHGVWVNMTNTHEAFESKLDTGFRLVNKSMKALSDNGGDLTLSMNEMRQNQILTERMSKRLAVNVTQLESSVQGLKKFRNNVNSRTVTLEQGYAQMNTSMETLQMLYGTQNASYGYLESLYNSLRASLAMVNTTLHDKLTNPVSSGGKIVTDFSTCWNRTIPGTKGTGTDSSAFSQADYSEPANTRAMGITCSTDYAEHYKLVSPRAGLYQCQCRGVSSVFKNNPSSIRCFVHVWECPVTTL